MALYDLSMHIIVSLIYQSITNEHIHLIIINYYHIVMAIFISTHPQQLTP